MNFEVDPLGIVCVPPGLQGTVPAISFKSDILAAKVNITNMDNEAFFNILDIPFEL